MENISENVTTNTNNKINTELSVYSLFYIFYFVWVLIFILNMFFPSNAHLANENFFFIILTKIFSLSFVFSALVCSFIKAAPIENYFIYSLFLSETISIFENFYFFFSIDAFEVAKDVTIILFAIILFSFRIKQNLKV